MNDDIYLLKLNRGTEKTVISYMRRILNPNRYNSSMCIDNASNYNVYSTENEGLSEDCCQAVV